VFQGSPPRANCLKKIEIDDFIAAAWAQHRSGPKILFFAAQIYREWLESFGHILHPEVAIRLLLLARKFLAQFLGASCCYLPRFSPQR
jgi:hypothetical protein